MAVIVSVALSVVPAIPASQGAALCLVSLKEAYCPFLSSLVIDNSQRTGRGWVYLLSFSMELLDRNLLCHLRKNWPPDGSLVY